MKSFLWSTSTESLLLVAKRSKCSALKKGPKFLSHRMVKTARVTRGGTQVPLEQRVSLATLYHFF